VPHARPSALRPSSRCCQRRWPERLGSCKLDRCTCRDRTWLNGMQVLWKKSPGCYFMLLDLFSWMDMGWLSQAS
jgi:hypothetical protein